MAPPQTPIDAAEAAFVERLARHVRPHASDVIFIGEGSNNRVWRLGDTVVIKLGKPHRSGVAAREHAKETWCAAAARAAGAPTPEILSVGEFEGRSYQIQAFSPGREPAPEEQEGAWDAMGRWARAFHAAPVVGWGPELVGQGVFGGDWAAHLAYNIEALVPDDPLLGLGLLDADASADLRRRFRRLAGKRFRFGLSHGDLAMPNVLADPATGEALALIDWGCAGAFPVPHYDLGEMIRAGRADSRQIDIFRRAYGLSDEEFAEVMADLPDLGALRDIDTLRWALAHAPDALERYIGHAKRALARLGYSGP
ncbi:MAG TPA: aminoglycoside phosphotransferase family protein [Caulobacteraceae bacterium]|jgi:aminoglycoside phosphotransferase (APT) family kinase protein|nr:aminoglycoside phosphotransferase family protein [Caulobacteraceae bacterium]